MTAGRAFGMWNNKDNTFQFKLPSGVCTADVTFMGTSGVYKFHFTSDSGKASYVAWEHLDYDHTANAFLLDCAFTPENAYDIACITNLPDATFVFIRQEHTHFSLPVKEIQGRIAFYVLAMLYVLANGVHDKASSIKEMFYDLELDEEFENVFDKFPWVTSERDGTGPRSKANNISMGTKLLGKGQKSKSSTTVGQGNCSSNNPLLGRMGREWILKNRCQNWLKMLKMMTAAQVGVSNHNH